MEFGYRCPEGFFENVMGHTPTMDHGIEVFTHNEIPPNDELDWLGPGLYVGQVKTVFDTSETNGVCYFWNGFTWIHEDCIQFGDDGEPIWDI